MKKILKQGSCNKGFNAEPIAFAFCILHFEFKFPAKNSKFFRFWVNVLFYLLCAADTQYIVEHFPVFFSYLVGARCSKTVYMLSPFSCSGQTYIPTVKEFNSYFFKW